MTTVKAVDSRTLKKWLDENDCVLIDVRESHEHRAERIQGAQLIPLALIQRDKLPELSSKKLVLHCGIGKRSDLACEKLLLEDPTLNIYNLEGGITAWKNENLPISKGTSANLSLDRQINIFMGCSVLIGLILGYWAHPAFLLLSVISGLILFFVGITGTSRLTMFIANMPWNKQRRDNHV